MKHAVLKFAVVVCALGVLTAHGQVYKWVDKDGKTQYSDQPPPPDASKAEATKIKSSSPSGPATATPAKAAADAGKPGDKPKVDPADKAKQDEQAAKVAKQNEEWCVGARAQLRTLQAGGRISFTNAQGERDFMSDEQIAQEIAKLQASMADTCK